MQSSQRRPEREALDKWWPNVNDENADDLFSLPFLMVGGLIFLIVRKEGSPNQGRLTVKPGQLILQVYCVLHAHHSKPPEYLLVYWSRYHINAKYIFYINISTYFSAFWYRNSMASVRGKPCNDAKV